MTNFLEITIDKFTFKTADDRSYTQQGVWARAEGGLIRTGISDYSQQRNGDVAFAEVCPESTRLNSGDEFASVETIKITLNLASPLSGRILETNPMLETTPEIINQDPYGDGWLALIEPTNWATERLSLLDAQAYFEFIKLDAEQEAKK